jgi:hypothetical protein
MQWPSEKGQRNKMIYKTQHRKIKIEQHESHKTPEVNSGAPEG